VLLNREIVRWTALPDVKEHLAILGFDAVGSTPEEFAEVITADVEKWGKVMRMANIRLY
jgi:tripartite-type tricarboxylate transporter receptor subunit TctC